METAYTHVVWLTQYVSSEWRHDLDALEVLLRLAGTKRRQHQGYYYMAVTEAAAKGIVSGWGDLPGMLGHLQDRFNTETDPYVRDTLLLAAALGWPGAEGLLDWLQEHMDNAKPSTRRKIVTVVADGWSGRSERLTWLQQRALRDKDAVRMAALDAIGDQLNRNSHARAWLEQIAIDGPDAELRALALRTLTNSWDIAEFRDVLRRAAVNDTAANVRMQALVLLGGHNDYYAVMQPKRLWGSGYWTLQNVNRRGNWYGASEREVTFLQSRAMEDSDPMVRSAAINGVCAYARKSRGSFIVLRSSLLQDADRDVRAIALVCLASKRSVPAALLRLIERVARSELTKLESYSSVREGAFRNLGQGNVRSDELGEESLVAIRDAAEQDADTGIRAAAAIAVSYFVRDNAVTLEWLRRLIQAEGSKEVVVILKEIEKSLELG